MLTFSELDRLTTVNLDFKPRWYQQNSVDSLFNYFYDGNKGNPLLIVPTGGGKSHILGMFCKKVITTWPEQRILILTHVDTIIRQDYLAIREHLAAGFVGIYSAGVDRKERRAVTIAGIQSIHSKHELFHKTTIILVDEAHLIPPSGTGQYRTFLSHFKCPVVGLTATHFRLGTGYLHEGKDRLFTDIAYEVDIVRLIEEGHLCQLIVPKDLPVQIDMEGVPTSGYDFSKKESAKRAKREGITEAIVQDLGQYKDKYKHWLIFAIDIEHAELITALLINEDIPTAMVHSKQSKTLNEALKHDFKSGGYQALVSVESLTTGFDMPGVDLISLMRATKSPVLHIQMIGRGLRTHQDKDHCLVLDYVGNVSRLGPINDVTIKTRKKKGNGKAITKICPECKTRCAGVTKVCPECDHVFEFKVNLNDKAAKDKIVNHMKHKVKPAVPPVWYRVDTVTYQDHYAKSGRIMLISYRCGLRTFFDYKNFNRYQKSGYHAEFWWLKHTRSPSLNTPLSSEEAVIRASSGDLKNPYSILVSEQGKYPDIKQVIFWEETGTPPGPK